MTQTAKLAWFTFIVSCCFQLSVFAAEQSTPVYNIAVNHHQYPLQYINEQGQPDGLFVDFWRLWANKSKHQVQFVPLATDNVDSNKLSQIDFYAGILNNPHSKQEGFELSANKQQVSVQSHITSVSFEQSFYINVHREYSHIIELEDLLPYAIGVLKNSAQAFYFKQYYPALSVKVFNSPEALYQAALTKQIIAFADHDSLRKNYHQKSSLTNFYPIHKRISVLPISFAIVSEKPVERDIKLSSDISQGIALISAQELTELYQKWFGQSEKRQRLLVTYSQLKPPYIGHNVKGEPEGLLIDLWRIWSGFSGVDVDFAKVSQVQATSQLTNDHADAHIAFADRALNEKIIPIHKLYQDKVQFFISQQLDRVKHVDDLAGKTIAIAAHAPYLLDLEHKYPNIQFLPYENLADALIPTNAEELDGIVGEAQHISWLLAQANLSPYYFSIISNYLPVSFHVLTKQNNDNIRQLIVNGFEQIPNYQLIDIEHQWLTAKQNAFFQQVSKRIKLSVEQQAWLLEHPQIKVGMTTNWSPMEFVDNYGDFVGINPDVFELIAQRMGTQFTFVPYTRWQDLIAAVENKEVDMITSVSNTEERQSFLNFSESYWHMPWGIVHPVTSGKKAVLSDFSDRKVAVLSGVHVISIINKLYPAIELVEVDTIEAGYHLLQKGQVAALVTSLAPASELLKRESLITMGLSVIDNLAVDGEQIGIRKDWPELLLLVNQALASISELEKQTIIDKWFNVEINTGFEKNVVIKLAIQIGVFTVIVIAVIIFWNRRLYHEIKRRKALEIKMKHMANHDELTGLANRTLLTERINSAINFHKRQGLTLAVLFIDLDGFKHINDNYGHDVGDELLVQLTDRLQACVRESDTVARFGGDEFVLLLTGLNDKKEAAFIAEKALKVIRQPVELSIATVAVSCSIGISAFPDDGDSDTELLKVADTLMYRVKAHGKNHYIFN
ncbi:diguanylate cyclase domain-containing protein [Thalassotalea agariperforans]